MAISYYFGNKSYFGYEQSIKNSIIVSGILLIVLEIIAVSFITIGLMKPLTQISKNVSDIISGNLGVRFSPVKGELGELSMML